MRSEVGSHRKLEEVVFVFTYCNSSLLSTTFLTGKKKKPRETRRETDVDENPIEGEQNLPQSQTKSLSLIHPLVLDIVWRCKTAGGSLTVFKTRS